MPDLFTMTDADMRNFGQGVLREFHSEFGSFEEAAQQLCITLFDSFVDGTGQSIFVLFRIFRLGTFDELPPDVQPKYNRNEAEVWLALAGSIGVEQAWCSRQTSLSRRAVAVTPEISPMFLAVFDQTNLQPELMSAVDEMPADTFSNYFHVQHAADSPMITDQEQFVDAYGVQSSIGMAGRFLNGQAYLAVGFSRVPIDHRAAELFAQLTPYVSTLLAAYETRGTLWTEA